MTGREPTTLTDVVLEGVAGGTALGGGITLHRGAGRDRDRRAG